MATMRTPDVTACLAMAACLLLAACGKTDSESSEERASDVASEGLDKSESGKEVAAAPSWKDRLQSADILKSGKDALGRYAGDAKGKLPDLDVQALQDRAAELRKSIETEDYDLAEKAGDKLGSLLDTRAIGDCVRFLRINSEKGSAAAKAAIDEHLGTVELSPEVRKFFVDMGDGLAAMDTGQRIDLIAAIVGIACEIKFGHGAGHVGDIVGALLKEAFQVERKSDISGSNEIVPNPKK